MPLYDAPLTITAGDNITATTSGSDVTLSAEGLETVQALFVAPGGTATTLTSFGAAITNTGTLSQITTTEAIGVMSQQATAASLNSSVGTASTNAIFLRGTTGPYAGFDAFASVYFGDASYNESGATTGSRFFFGLTDQTAANSVASDTPAGNRVGFSRISVNGGVTDTNWFFTTKDGTTESRTDTTLAFTPQHVYEMRFVCVAGGTSIDWTITDVTAGTTRSGTQSNNLPTAATAMRYSLFLLTINATVRRLSYNRISIKRFR